MRSGIDIHSAEVCHRKPGRSVAHDLRINHLGYVTVYRVESKRRRIPLLSIDDMAVGHETELDNRLETVAYAEHETVSLL